MAGNGVVRCWSIASSISSAVAYSCQTPGCFGMGARKVVFAGKPDADPLDGDAVDERQHDVGGQAGLTDGLHLVFDGWPLPPRC